MKFWKIQHKPTGLFYRPAVSSEWKAHLSKQGKTYSRKPSLKHISGYRHPDDKPEQKYDNFRKNSWPYRKAASDFEVIEYSAEPVNP